MKARVTVTLKSGVLDPQGLAIHGSLKSLGFAGVVGVRQGKVFDIELANIDPKAAEQNLRGMCEKLLANTVIENFSIEIVTEKAVASPPPPPPPRPAEPVAAVAPEPPVPPEPEPLPDLPGADLPIDLPVRKPSPPPDGAI